MTGLSVAAWLRSISTAVGSTIVFSAFASDSERIARSQHAGSSHKYAPRPLRFPVGSISTAPSGVRTIRTRVRLADRSRQEMHIRCGTCFVLGRCCPRAPSDFCGAGAFVIVATTLSRFSTRSPVQECRQAAVLTPIRSCNERADLGCSRSPTHHPELRRRRSSQPNQTPAVQRPGRGH